MRPIDQRDEHLVGMTAMEVPSCFLARTHLLAQVSVRAQTGVTVIHQQASRKTRVERLS
jgi:hypothetical protein